MWTYWICGKNSSIEIRDTSNILRFVEDKKMKNLFLPVAFLIAFQPTLWFHITVLFDFFFVKRFFFLAHKLCKNKIVIRILQHSMYFLYFVPHLQPGCFGLLNNLNIKKICTTFYISFNFLDLQDLQVNIYEIDT